MRSYLATQLIGTIWFATAILAHVEGGSRLGCLGLVVVAAGYYSFSLYLWATQHKELSDG